MDCTVLFIGIQQQTFLDEQHSSYLSEEVLSFPPQVADEISKDEMNQNQLFFSFFYLLCLFTLYMHAFE